MSTSTNKQGRSRSTDNLFGRLGVCLMCKEAEGKYRCPECDLVTCSLPCVNRHKKEFDCSGVRQKTDFVPMNKMNELHILSDYRLLEELSRLADSTKRVKTKRSTRKEAPLPHYMLKLRAAVRKRNSRIYFLPPHFARRSENTTKLDWKTNKISWRVQVVFLHAQKFPLVVSKCPEDMLLSQLVDKCLSTAIERKKEFRKHFDAYRRSESDVHVLMQAEKVPGAHGKMYRLDNSKSLKENMEGKRIVEFPVLYIALKGFYNAEALTDVRQVNTKSKTSNFLLSTESGNEDEEEKDELRLNTSGITMDDQDNSNDDDDSLDEALDCLDKTKLKDVLNSLYQIADEQIAK